MRPKSNVNVEAQPVNGYFYASRHNILLSDPIENYIYGTHKDFVYTIKAEKQSEEVKVLSLPR